MDIDLHYITLDITGSVFKVSNVLCWCTHFDKTGKTSMNSQEIIFKN